MMNQASGEQASVFIQFASGVLGVHLIRPSPGKDRNVLGWENWEFTLEYG
jgi:hypothetical protein